MKEEIAKTPEVQQARERNDIDPHFSFCWLHLRVRITAVDMLREWS